MGMLSWKYENNCYIPATASSPIIAFIDESLRNQDYYFLTAIVCTQEQNDSLTSIIDKKIPEYVADHPRIPVDVELHAYEILQRHGVWKGYPLRKALSLYRSVFHIVKESGVLIFVEGIKINHATAKETHPRHIVFTRLLETINRCGSPENKVRIIADDHHTARESRSYLRSYQENGINQGDNYLINIESLDFADSQTYRLLQVSDMITYLYNRCTTIQESNPKARREKERIWSILNLSSQETSLGYARIRP